MNRYGVPYIVEKSSILSEAVERLNATLNSAEGKVAWDDVVKYSYVRYGNDCFSSSQTISACASKVKNSCDDLNNRNIQGTMDAAKALCAKIGGL